MIWRADYYLIKIIRADEFDFFREFVFECTQTARQQSIFPLRKGSKKAYTVTGEGVHERSSKRPQYSPEQKLGFSKATSISLVIPDVPVLPFGHHRERKEKLVGMMFSLEQVLLTKRLFIYDGGTVRRPYDHETEEGASDPVDSLTNKCCVRVLVKNPKKFRVQN